MTQPAVPPLPPLPPAAVRLDDTHGDGCFGCGADGIAGLHMPVHQVGDEVVGDITFGPPHTAGHGGVHGGAVAAVCDDILSYLLFAHSMLAVTGTLGVGYRRPVYAGRPYRLTVRIVRQDGRKVFLAGEGVGADGVTAFTVESVFIRVDPEHFDRPGVRIHPRLRAAGPGAAPAR